MRGFLHFFCSFWHKWTNYLFPILYRANYFFCQFCEQIIFLRKKHNLPPPPGIKWPAPYNLRVYNYFPLLCYSDHLIALKNVPANKNHLYIICTTSVQRLRRWSIFVQMLYKCFMFPGVIYIVVFQQITLAHVYCSAEESFESDTTSRKLLWQFTTCSALRALGQWVANGKYIIIIIIIKQLYYTVRSEPCRCNTLSLSPVVHHDALIHRESLNR